MNKIKIFMMFVLICIGICNSKNVFSMHVFPDTTYPSYDLEQKKEKNININFSVQSGVMMGVMDELVFYKDVVLSELNWDLKPVVFFGFAVGFNYKFFFLNLGYWTSLYNNQVGHIEDSDWDKDTGAHIYYSKHNCFLKGAHLADISIFFMVYKNRFLKFSLSNGFNYKIIKVTGVDGFKEYPPGSPRVYLDGKFLYYHQEYFIYYFGPTISFLLPKKFTLGLSLYYSPLLFCKALDKHYERDLDFYDSIAYGQYLSPALELGYKIDSNVSIALNFQYIKVFVSRGSSYSIDTATNTISPLFLNGAGVGFETFNVSFSIKYNVFSI